MASGSLPCTRTAQGRPWAMTYSWLVAGSLTWLVPLGVATAAAADWPQHLGPQRNGISSEQDLLESWPADGPKEVWRVAGGVGMSGLAVQKGRLLTLVQADGRQWLVAHEAKSGKELWRADLAPEYRNSMGDGPRATPTIVNELAFAFTGEGILAAVQVADGAVRWSHNTVRERGGKPADYGMASSPLVVDGRVIVVVGAPGATVAAYDMASGKLAWTSGDDPAGYSSPALLELHGRPQVVVATGNSILGLDPREGTPLWRYAYETDFNCNIATPLACQGGVFISSGENHGSVLLELKPAGDKFEVTERWASQGAKSVLRNEWQTSILQDGYLYGLDNVGSAGPVTHLTCVKAATGERAWQKTRFGKGNLIAADGKLWISTMAGELVVVRTVPSGYEELGRAQVLESTRQAPALCDGLLYLRDNADIVCLDVRR